MKKIRTLFGTKDAVHKISLYPSVYRFLEPLLSQPQATVEEILDEALAIYGTDLIAQRNDIGPNSGSVIKDVRSRLFEYKENQEKTGNAKGAVLANVYLKFEEYLRLGGVDSSHPRGFSELKAGRLVAKTMFPRAKLTRKNASQNRLTQRYWYRYHSRSVITGYRYFLATGCLLPETRGKCKGNSLIHNPNVKRYCLEIIGELGKTWSARTFRDKISAKLYSLGYLHDNKKIGRSTATYFLRQLGMVLIKPKKGIYKDGHERADTVQNRIIYTAMMNEFKHRERTYAGVELQIDIPPESTLEREVIRVYHDECIYASHEGALQVWVMEGKDGKYKKPRGEIVMASGFICRSSHMLYRPF
jgi:hypothetical protein